MENNKDKPRRQFLKKGIPRGIALATGLGLFVKNIRERDKPAKTVRMISSDGKLYDVDPIHVGKMCKGRVSNRELLDWMENEKEFVTRQNEDQDE